MAVLVNSSPFYPLQAQEDNRMWGRARRQEQLNHGKVKPSRWRHGRGRQIQSVPRCVRPDLQPAI
uniref:Uncharacterized protein n=1 Tax=Leersia perrieri TaxID=77586 RepID=A0A0D9WEJ2_9ORYZ